MRAFYFIYLVSAAILASSCSYKQSHALFENKAQVAGLNDSVASGIPAPYRIQPRDILQIKNLQNIKYIVDDLPQNSAGTGGSGGQGQTFEVEDDGTVALPSVGRVPVGGLTRVEATKKIEAVYRTELLKDPIFEVKITNLKVTLFGEVSSQGNFPLIKDNTTLVEMIGQAGGLTANANEKDVKIIRGTGQNKTITVVDMGNVNSISAPNTYLQNGDVIYVSKNKRAIRSDNFQNLSTIVQPITLLLSTVLIIFTLKRL
ncbi:polysaccharide biosynthesis/export family protein [Mucilaginibacter pedocola]|uniref:Uncharacterized protein n=1 Tax=Mucilaginibacter pedocola TaxID=1792845 RepID=A0A1S9PAV3_9SPHI|nr:polysaccharide biosynthesis/export family protein [Mucilaginibacter pedocola]OOQ58061.1 hypothetical protein BC343_10395 [Mucilaginibacter pedocola]